MSSQSTEKPTEKNAQRTADLQVRSGSEDPRSKNAAATQAVLDVIAQLRNSNGGCPWDIEQSFATIAPYTIEEAYEVADAIERNDMPALKEELGDLLFQVAFHARMAEEQGAFDFADVAQALADKMIERHPHVFSEASDGRTADQQTVAWETLKGLPYVSSPLLYRGRLYLVKTGGFISCLDAKTGKALYESERLGVAGEYYATPVAVGDHLLICAQRGTVFMVRAGDHLEIVARNDLGEGLSATPAVVANTLYLRGEKHLWAFGD